MLQRNRELVSGPLTLDYFVQKAADGWKLSALEWVREVDATVPSDSVVPLTHQEIPYGSRLSEDGSHLEHNPLERTVLLLILEKIVRDERITDIARELNSQGMTTRSGAPWSPSAVFDLLPRLIEAGPSLLKSPEWQGMRSPPKQV